MRPMRYAGRVWVIATPEGVPIDNVDTDMIFHNSHLHVTDAAKMGQHAFGNLEGWRDFPTRCRRGDMILCGKNFGAGSSRQQAVDCFMALGISVILAESFGSIYKRNAINAGMAILEVPGVFDSLFRVRTGDELIVDLESATLHCGGHDFRARMMPEIQKRIYQAGNLFAYGRTLA